MENKTIEILKDTQLSKGGLSVVLFLMNIGGIWTKGQSELAQELGTSQRQLLDNLSNLEERGYIVKEINPKKRNSKIYKIKGGQNA